MAILADILVAILDFSNYQHTNKYITYIIKILDPENIPLDSAIIFLSVLESKIWQLLYFDGHLVSHFVCSKPTPITSIYTHQFDFPGHANIPLVTKIIFLASLETKIWLFLYSSSHLGNYLGLFKKGHASANKKCRYAFSSDVYHKNNHQTFHHFQISFSPLPLDLERSSLPFDWTLSLYCSTYLYVLVISVKLMVFCQIIPFLGYIFFHIPCYL